MKKIFPIFIVLTLLFPVTLFAAFESISSMLTDIIGIINLIIPLIIGIAVVVFFWGLIKFLARVGGSTQAVEQGKRIMAWGIIVIFVMTTLWGIIFLMQNIFGVGGTGLFEQNSSPAVEGIDDPNDIPFPWGDRPVNA